MCMSFGVRERFSVSIKKDVFGRAVDRKWMKKSELVTE